MIPAPAAVFSRYAGVTATHDGIQVSYCSRPKQHAANGNKQNERERVVPEQARSLHQEPGDNQRSCLPQSSCHPGTLDFSHGCGLQYFKWSACAMLCTFSWQPEDVHESLLLLMSIMICG